MTSSPNLCNLPCACYCNGWLWEYSLNIASKLAALRSPLGSSLLFILDHKIGAAKSHARCVATASTYDNWPGCHIWRTGRENRLAKKCSYSPCCVQFLKLALNCYFLKAHGCDIFGETNKNKTIGTMLFCTTILCTDSTDWTEIWMSSSENKKTQQIWAYILCFE